MQTRRTCFCESPRRNRYARFGPHSQKQVRFETEVTREHAQKRVRFRPSWPAETGTHLRCGCACRPLEMYVPVSAEPRAEMGTSIATYAAWHLVFAETGTVYGRFGQPSPPTWRVLSRGCTRHAFRASCASRALARPYGRRVLHHPIRMNSIWTAPPRGAGILLRVASPHGGRALGEPRAGQRRPTMTLHNKRRQPE